MVKGQPAGGLQYDILKEHFLKDKTPKVKLTSQKHDPTEVFDCPGNTDILSVRLVGDEEDEDLHDVPNIATYR